MLLDLRDDLRPADGAEPQPGLRLDFATWDKGIRHNVRRLVALVHAAATLAGPEPGRHR